MGKTKKKNYYAIKYGIDPNTNEPVKDLIFKTWKETEPYVKGVKGAQYSGFYTLPEAEEYLGSKDPLMHIKDGKLPQDALHCYVDGSYNAKLPNYGFGLVCVKNNKVVYVNKGAGKNNDAISMQQIAGELLGAMIALIYAKKNGYKKVAIIHDYKGVAYHATGFWKRDNKFSEDYYNWMQDFFKKYPEIEVTFCKVDAHTGEDFNEMADGLAKLSVELTPEKRFYTYCEKYGIAID